MTIRVVQIESVKPSKRWVEALMLLSTYKGDEPFIQKSQLETVMQCFDDPRTQIATLGKPFRINGAVENPNSPKIVLDNDGYALYFSRSVIPFVRGKEHEEWLSHFPYLKHIGLYAYRTEVLRELVSSHSQLLNWQKASNSCVGYRMVIR